MPHCTPARFVNQSRRLDEAVRELPAAAAALEAPLAAAGLASGAEPLARQLQLRELQQAYVLLTLLAKKTRVRGRSGTGRSMAITAPVHGIALRSQVD